jgi:hypothetical protein
MKMYWKKAIFFFSLLSFVHCEDPLPAYVNPKDLLTATVTVVSDAKIVYTHGDVNNVDDLRIAFSSNSFIINIGVKNTFDETLQDVASIDGKVELFLENQPDVKATLPIKDINVVGNFIDANNILTLDPDTTMWFKTSWKYKFDDGTWAFSRIKYSESQKPGARPGTMLRVHDPAVLKVKANVRLFRAVNPARSKEISATLNFEGTVIPPP